MKVRVVAARVATALVLVALSLACGGGQRAVVVEEAPDSSARRAPK